MSIILSYIPLRMAYTYPSLPQRRGMHLHPPPTRRRQVRLRIRRRALVTRPDTRNHSPIRNIDALEPERRVPRQCRGRGALEGKPGGIQEAR